MNDRCNFSFKIVVKLGLGNESHASIFIVGAYISTRIAGAAPP